MVNTTQIIQLVGAGLAIIIGVGIVRQIPKALSGFELFPSANAEESSKEQGGQTSDVEAERARGEAELGRLEAELARIEEEANRAEKEGRRGDSEFLRAQNEAVRAEAEKQRAENDRLAIILSDAKGTLETVVTIGEDSQESDLKKDVAQSSTTEVNSNPVTETPSGQTETVDAPNTIVADSKEQVISVDVNKEVIDKISNRNTRPRSSFFSEGSAEQVIVMTDPKTNAKITGAGSTNKKTVGVIRSTKPKTLSDVLKIFPNFSASQARDFLNRSGTFATEQDRKAFEEFDFRTNTGGGQKVPTTNIGGESVSTPNARTRVSKTTRELEIAKAEEKLKQILASQETQGVNNSNKKATKPKRIF